MKAYIALVKIDLRLALRDRSVLFFNYLLPVLFLGFAPAMGRAFGGGTAHIVTLVFVFGVLGNGLFGAGVRAVQERDADILRRFKVTPISAVPLLVGSLVTGWAIFVPTMVIVLALAHFSLGMAIPPQPVSLFAILSMGVLAFRAMGLIVASVANSMQESNILVHTLYMPMLFLSGATFPLTSVPEWVGVAARFLPATYLVEGLEGIFLRGETWVDSGPSILALGVTVLLATFIAAKLFRWEKEERIRPSAKLWVLGVLLPFFALGAYQVWQGR